MVDGMTGPVGDHAQSAVLAVLMKGIEHATTPNRIIPMENVRALQMKPITAMFFLAQVSILF